MYNIYILLGIRDGTDPITGSIVVKKKCFYKYSQNLRWHKLHIKLNILIPSSNSIAIFSNITEIVPGEIVSFPCKIAALTICICIAMLLPQEFDATLVYSVINDPALGI